MATPNLLLFRNMLFITGNYRSFQLREEIIFPDSKDISGVGGISYQDMSPELVTIWLSSRKRQQDK